MSEHYNQNYTEEEIDIILQKIKETSQSAIFLIDDWTFERRVI